jgi:hypothetical protein
LFKDAPETPGLATVLAALCEPQPDTTARR